MEPAITDGPAVPVGLELAPIWKRSLGLLLDQLVAAVIPVIVVVSLGRSAHDVWNDNTVVFWVNAAMVTIGLLHETIGVWRWGRTVGKLAMGTRVVHAVDGGSVSLSSSLLRSLLPAALSVVPSWGAALSLGVYLWALVDPRRQGIHDKAAGTLVVRRIARPVHPLY
ncbi:MAG: RDD family protein [Actinomycetota bacterium]